MRTKSMDCRAKYGSMVCAAQSVDCTNPYFAPNISTLLYIYIHIYTVILEKNAEVKQSAIFFHISFLKVKMLFNLIMCLGAFIYNTL